MEKTKTSKKALRGLIADSMKDAIETLELPKPTKKVNKLLQRNSKKLASLFADMIRRENKKKKKETMTHSKPDQAPRGSGRLCAPGAWV